MSGYSPLIELHRDYLKMTRKHETDRRDILVKHSHDTTKLTSSRKKIFTSTFPDNEFWLKVFKEVPILKDCVSLKDHLLLSYLRDVRTELHVPSTSTFSRSEKLLQLEKQSFKLIFEFEKNKYMSNTVLTKEFFYQGGVFDKNPVLSYSVGSGIHWKEDLSKILVTKTKVNTRTGKTKTKTKEINVPSFFNFFNTLSTFSALRELLRGPISDERLSLPEADEKIGSKTGTTKEIPVVKDSVQTSHGSDQSIIEIDTLLKKMDNVSLSNLLNSIEAENFLGVFIRDHVIPEAHVYYMNSIGIKNLDELAMKVETGNIIEETIDSIPRDMSSFNVHHGDQGCRWDESDTSDEELEF